MAPPCIPTRIYSNTLISYNIFPLFYETRENYMILYKMTNVNCDTFLFFFIIILMFLHVYDQVSRNCLKLGPTHTLPPPKKKKF